VVCVFFGRTLSRAKVNIILARGAFPSLARIDVFGKDLYVLATQLEATLKPCELNPLD